MEVNRHRKLNDLKWLIESPPILWPCESSKGISLIADLNKWVENFGGSFTTSDTILKHINDKKEEICPSYYRLGRYAECLFSTWAKAHPAVTVLDNGVQIRDSTNQTLGELDFLLKINDQPVHLEMAVKYYLLADEKAQLSSFVGPNPKDRLDLKYSKLVNQQIQWLQKENIDKGYEFKTKLSADHLNQNWKRALLVKGMLFIHWETQKEHIILPDEINPNCDKGTWCYQKEMAEVFESHNTVGKWMILPKLRWLSPAEPQDESEVLSATDIFEKIENHRKPVMVAGLRTGKHGREVENLRAIIVPNIWPHQ